jgi:hypothetical protein
MLNVALVLKTAKIPVNSRFCQGRIDRISKVRTCDKDRGGSSGEKDI